MKTTLYLVDSLFSCGGYIHMSNDPLPIRPSESPSWKGHPLAIEGFTAMQLHRLPCNLGPKRLKEHKYHLCINC